MTDFFNIEWLNHNAIRSYPLAEDATQKDITRTFEIPNDFIVGLYFPVHAGLNVEPEKFFIRSIVAFSTGYSISLAYDDGSNDPPVVATALIASATHKENTIYALPGVDVPDNDDLSFSDSVGKIVIGRLDSIEKQPAGQYLFDFEDGKLDSDTIRPMIRGVSSIQVVNGSEVSERIHGDVRLVAGTNMQISITSVGSETQIRFDAIEGAGLIDECECNENLPDGPCIKTINGVPPDDSGNFNILPLECLEILPIENGISIADTCADPCCGSEELEILTQELDKFGRGISSLIGQINRLESELNTLATSILGSQLHEGPCNDCS